MIRALLILIIVFLAVPVQPLFARACDTELDTGAFHVIAVVGGYAAARVDALGICAYFHGRSAALLSA